MAIEMGFPSLMAIVPKSPAIARIEPTDKSMPARDNHERHAERHDVNDRCLPGDARQVDLGQEVWRGNRQCNEREQSE